MTHYYFDNQTLLSVFKCQRKFKHLLFINMSQLLFNQQSTSWGAHKLSSSSKFLQIIQTFKS